MVLRKPRIGFGDNLGKQTSVKYSVIAIKRYKKLPNNLVMKFVYYVGEEWKEL